MLIPSRENQSQRPDLIPKRVSLSEIPDSTLIEVVRCRYPVTSDGVQTEASVEEVSLTLGLKNPMQVSRLIAEARRRKLFHVAVVSRDQSADAIARVKQRFPFLRIVETVGTPADDHNILMRSLGSRAAAVFDSLYERRGRMTVSIGGGDTIRHMVQQLQRRERRVTIGPTALLTRSAIERVYDSPFLAMFAHWESLSLSDANICAIPPLPTQQAGEAPVAYRKRLRSYCKDFYQGNQAVEKVVEKSFDPEVVFIGVADLSAKSRIIQSTYKLFGYDFEKLDQLGGRVDLNYSILDSRGLDLCGEIAKAIGAKPFHPQSHPFLLAMSPARFKELSEDTRRPRDVVLVAGAHYKVRCVRAVLQAGLVNGLITDDATLSYLAKDSSYQDSAY
jgi:hypothetical protein